MVMLNGELMQIHEQRVKELTGMYQDSRWQEAQFRNQISALASRIRSWFADGDEAVAGAGSSIETQTIPVESR